MEERWSGLRSLHLLILGYLPGIILPFIAGLGYVAVWFFFTAWTIYVFLLLLISYILEKSGEER